MNRNRGLEKEIRKSTPCSLLKFLPFSRRGGFLCADDKEKGDTCVSPFSSDFSGNVPGK